MLHNHPTVQTVLYMVGVLGLAGCGPDEPSGRGSGGGSSSNVGESSGTASSQQPLPNHTLTQTRRVDTYADLSNMIPAVATNDVEDYVEQCRGAGVPVPDEVTNSTGWVNRGVAGPVYLGPIAEVWTYEDEDGVCVALPRWTVLNESSVFGVICLGRETSKTCFFDNPENHPFDRNEPIPITSFHGGFRLASNNQGTCTLCHAGENPFVIHPYDMVEVEPDVWEPGGFQNAKNAVDLFAQDWPTPIVHFAWPGNPGPIEELGPVPPNEGRCDAVGCHTAGGQGGRFPVFSEVFAGTLAYCPDPIDPETYQGVLGWALDNTMPPPDGSATNYTTHETWLLHACKGPATPGASELLDLPPVKPSPPKLGPLYACSNGVTVTNVKDKAEVTLSIDGTPVDARIANGTSVEFPLGTPLVKDQVVATRQNANGQLSDAVWVTVEEFPGQLPVPIIDPVPLHECAAAINVETVPGATLHIDRVRVNNQGTLHWDRPTHGCRSCWLALGLPRFEEGDAFTVSQSLCGGPDASGVSSPEVVAAKPVSLNPVVIEPAVSYGGVTHVTLSSIVQGARVIIEEDSIGEIINAGSVPINVWREIDIETELGGPAQDSHHLTVRQQFCEGVDLVTSSDLDVDIEECVPGSIPAPVIAQPHEGDTFVLVLDKDPSATIHVVDDGPVELGHGTGTVVMLFRALSGGETLTVYQALSPSCVSEKAYVIDALETE